jgi:hypothetical protein
VLTSFICLRYDLRMKRPLRLVKPLPPNARCANPRCNKLRYVPLRGRVIAGRTYAAADPCEKCRNLLVIAV